MAFIPSAEAGAKQRRKALGGNHDDKGDHQQQRSELVLKQAHRRQQLETNPAGADKAEYD
jgi:hypothetical protein